MNKRIKKKKENALALITVRDISNKTLTLYINKKHWNKGNNSTKSLIHDSTNDYITTEQLTKTRCKYIVRMDNVINCNVYIKKSWDNKNHIKISEL